jgi:L-arabinonolactonase
MSEAACVVDLRAEVTESPVWVPEERALYFVDIYKPAIHRLDPESGALETWPMAEPVGCVALRRDGGLVAGFRSGFGFVDLATGGVEMIAAPEPERPGNRLNDGRCDRRGRFWAGSMVEALDLNDAALHRLDPDRRCRRMVGDIICSNGLAWSPDDRTMYHADSRQSTVWAWDFDLETGGIRNRRVFAQSRAGEGRPDGAAIDEEGCYWSARYDGWRIVRHAPDGREIATIAMPVRSPTMCAFGGRDLDILYVTSAGQKPADGQPRDHAQAGGVFALDVGARGLREPRFAG